MKTTTVLAIAIGLGALGACQQSPREQAAENIEANAANVADMLEANVGNAAEQMEGAAGNAGEAIRAEGENAAAAAANNTTN